MQRCYALPLSFIFLFVLSVDVHSRGPLIAEQLMAQYGGPETRTRCINELKTHGFKCEGLRCRRSEWRTCTEWATDLKQHKIIARMYGPDSITNPDEQLKDIARACLLSGLVMTGWAAVITAPIDLSEEALRVGIEACLKTTNVLSQIVVRGELAIAAGETNEVAT